MIQSEFEVKNEFGNVVFRTEDKNKAEEKKNSDPDKLVVEETKYYQEYQAESAEKVFLESVND